MTAPVLTHASYNAATGLLTLTGSHLTTKAGDYTATDFTLTGDGGGSYTLSSGSAIFGALVGTSVTIKLSGTDQLAIDGLLNKNGTQANDGITTYNLSATSGWDSNASAITTEGVTVSGVTAPVITTVSYNATTGAFSFTGTNLDNHGSGNGIAQTAFTLTGGKSGSYHFNAGDTVSDLGKTGFTITLDSTDLALVNAFVNKNGTSPLSGSAYNLTATSKWDSDSGAAITSKPVTVNGIPANLNSAAYNAATGTLTLNGGNLSGKAADYQVSAFTLTGDGGNSVALSSGSMISGVPTSSSVVITLSTADQLAVDGLLNKNGAQANDGVTTYNLSASAGWDTYAKPITTEGLMVSGITPPAIATVNYNAATGVFTFTGSNLDNHGSGNGIALNAFTLTGGNSGSFHFSASDTVSNLGRTGFAISLSAADQAAVAAFVTKNGPLPLSGAAYNLTATSKWDSDSGAAITTKAVLASGVPLPATLSSASYNAATGSLTLNGNHFSASADVYSVSDFTLKGDGGATYALSSGSLVSGTPTSTSVTIQLSSADELAVNGLFNKNGVHANDGVTTYNLSATAGWDANASPVTTSGVTVSNVTPPTLAAVAYNAATGVFTFSGANLVNHGGGNGIALNDFTLTGGNSGYFTFTASDSVSNLGANGFTVTLSSADQTAVNAFVDANGGSPSSGAAYNLAATANWDSDSGAAISTLGVSASNTGALSAGLLFFAGVDASGNTNLYAYNGSKLNAITAASASGNGLNPTALTAVGTTLYLNGQDASGNSNLFSYNGGKLNEITGAHASSNGLDPTQLTAVDNTLYMSGLDANGNFNLFSSNGGTLNEINSALASATGFNPSGLTALGNTLYMTGTDANDQKNLFAYTGGTLREITAATAGSHGLNPTDLTAAGNTLYMLGLDAKGNNNLFACNGSTLNAVSAAKGVVFGAAGLNPSDLTAVRNTLYMSGIDGSNQSNLFSYNGTALNEVTAAVANPKGLAPTDLTAVGNMLYLNGLDSSGKHNLFAENGSTLNEVSSALASSSGLNPTDLTAIGNTLYLIGNDANGNKNLFAYDGVSLKEISSALMYATPAAVGTSPVLDFNPAYLTAVNGVLYVEGADANGHQELFSYNGGTLTEITGGSTGVEVVGVYNLQVV